MSDSGRQSVPVEVQLLPSVFWLDEKKTPRHQVQISQANDQHGKLLQAKNVLSL